MSSNKTRSLQWGLVYLALAVFFTASTVAAWLYVQGLVVDNYRTEQRSDLEVELAILRSTLEENIRNSIHVTEGLSAVIKAEPELAPDRFEALAGHFLGVFPELRNIAAAPELVIRYMTPLEGNERALGLNYRETPAQYDAVLAAIEARGIVLAGPVNLVQGGQGFINRAPIFLTDPDTGAETLWGIVSTVVDTDAFYEQSGLLGDLPYDIAIRGRDSLGAQGEVFFGDPALFDSDPVTLGVSVPNGAWLMAATPKGGWALVPENLSTIRTIIFAVGALLLAIAALITWLVHQRLRADEQLYNAIESLQDGFAYFDDQDRLTVFNQKYRQIYAASSDYIKKGATFEEILRGGLKHGQYPNAEGREEEWLAERLRLHFSGTTDIEQQLDDGRWLKVTETRSSEGGIVGFRVDITELKVAKDNAEKASRAKTEFLNVMSHELRTPLTVIIGYAKFLTAPHFLISVKNMRAELDKPEPDAVVIRENFRAVMSEIEGFAGKISDSGGHLLSIINDMLDLAKIEADRIELNIAPIELSPFVQSVMDQFQHGADAKNLTLDIDIGDVRVMADKLRLRQILINLIGNALKFTDAGHITVDARCANGMVELSVTDTGCGIPQDSLEAIFDSFSQVDNSVTRKAGGTGLGLAITKRFVELQGGTIRAASELGVGSTFSFTVPVDLVEETRGIAV